MFQPAAIIARRTHDYLGLIKVFDKLGVKAATRLFHASIPVSRVIRKATLYSHVTQVSTVKLRSNKSSFDAYRKLRFTAKRRECSSDYDLHLPETISLLRYNCNQSLQDICKLWLYQ